MKQLNFKVAKFPVPKKDYAKVEKQRIFPLMYLAMKIKYHIVFILQNKLLENMLIYYYYRILKNAIVF